MLSCKCFLYHQSVMKECYISLFVTEKFTCKILDRGGNQIHGLDIETLMTSGDNRAYSYGLW